jgi:hypothetical protein
VSRKFFRPAAAPERPDSGGEQKVRRGCPEKNIFRTTGEAKPSEASRKVKVREGAANP